ncbi:MAG: DUF2851 family protein [Fodinibius sp.]|nr:DUF2851 family protein [Fodinibius sp.]
MIHDSGQPNKSDGPDFTGAETSIGNLTLVRRMSGIHWQASDWKGHGHQHDPDFGKVILHVVFGDNNEPIEHADWVRPFPHSVFPII